MFLPLLKQSELWFGILSIDYTWTHLHRVLEIFLKSGKRPKGCSVSSLSRQVSFQGNVFWLFQANNFVQSAFRSGIRFYHPNLQEEWAFFFSFTWNNEDSVRLGCLGKLLAIFTFLKMSRREENVSLDERRRGQGDRGPGCPWGRTKYSCAKGTWRALMPCCHCLEILPNFSTNDSTFSLCTESLELCSWSWRGNWRQGVTLSVSGVCWLESSTDRGHIWSELLTQMPLTEK